MSYAKYISSMDEELKDKKAFQWMIYNIMSWAARANYDNELSVTDYQRICSHAKELCEQVVAGI